MSYRSKGDVFVPVHEFARRRRENFAIWDSKITIFNRKSTDIHCDGKQTFLVQNLMLNSFLGTKTLGKHFFMTKPRFSHFR